MLGRPVLRCPDNPFLRRVDRFQMVKTATVRLYFPADAFGNLICWRLESAYSHATIELDGTIYSATFPRVVAVSPYNTAFGMPPREGRAFSLVLSDEQHDKAKAWFSARVGTSYDVLAMLGWAFRVKRWQSETHCYCFDSVYRCLAAAGVLQPTDDFVSGDELIDALYSANVVVYNNGQ